MLLFKKKKNTGDIILHLSTKNLNLIYGPRDIEHAIMKLVFLGHFFALTAPWRPKTTFLQVINNHIYMLVGIVACTCNLAT